LVIVNVKPPTVAVAALNVGVARILCDVPDTVPVADSKPVRVVVIVTVEEPLLPKPEAVIVLVESETEPAVVVAVYA